jgi:hypothetical protein
MRRKLCELNRFPSERSGVFDVAVFPSPLQARYPPVPLADPQQGVGCWLTHDTPATPHRLLWPDPALARLLQGRRCPPRIRNRRSGTGGWPVPVTFIESKTC